jgi:non-homologous end joining protein Ku
MLWQVVSHLEGCPVEEREVSYSEIKKGYQITKDEYIIIDDKHHRHQEICG